MTDSVLAVLLRGQIAAELHRAASGQLMLRYDDSYRADPAATPISAAMPLTSAEHDNNVVTPWLWGLLPDDREVLRRWGREFSVSSASPFSLLGTPIGRDCPGAVQLCPPSEIGALSERVAEAQLMSDADIALRLRDLHANRALWLGSDFRGQFSLGGAQAKTALHRSDGQWYRAMGSLPSTHIIKPAIAEYRWSQVNEHLCLAAASHADLPAVRTSLVTFEDETAIVVERFDRVWRGGHVERLHQEDLCQALSVHPDHKYQSDGGPGPEDVAGLLRSVVPGRLAADDVWRFVDALAFNWLIAGTDAHAKNHALLLHGSWARLAPLFDVASFLPYDDSKGHKVNLAMKIGDGYRLTRADRSDAWQKTASGLGLDAEDVVARVADLASRLPAAVAEAAADPAIADCGAEDFAQRLVELIAARVGHCAAILEAAA
ncbi:type II toxin-antitoxin system HipA family toxin [Candidatus Poriferisodalis sp.]|uniref:type II toxin-antitoxin system HipA family toxin n=1 Tax=Candidatus Poriferisodalis sp. TaxID=3101277 RepID=UPI003B5BA59F